jgi:hypothetical protein
MLAFDMKYDSYGQSHLHYIFSNRLKKLGKEIVCTRMTVYFSVKFILKTYATYSFNLSLNTYNAPNSRNVSILFFFLFQKPVCSPIKYSRFNK